MTEDEDKTSVQERAGQAFLQTVGAGAILAGVLAALWLVPVIIGAAFLFFWPTSITNGGEPQRDAGSAWLLGFFLYVALGIIGAAIVGLHSMGQEIFAPKKEEEA